MNLLQTIRTIEEVAKGIPNVHTVVSAFEDLNHEDTVYSAVIIQQQSHTHNDDWMQYNFYIGMADRLVEDGSNELSVQSTAMNTIHSIVRALRNILPSAEISYSNTNVFTQRFTALCAGAYETVSIILPISECDDSNEGIPGLNTLSTTITENGDYNFIPDGLGFDSVHVVVDVPPFPKPEEEFDVKPTTTDQRITPTAGHAFGGGTVRAVTSEIDNNIKPENIRNGVNILGVEGTIEVEPDYHYMDGTIDKEGLKAIGWTDEDVLTYKQNIPPHYVWEDDLYKVSDENKALYLLDDPNPSSYKSNPNIEYVPNKNMESYFAKASGFYGMNYIKGIPFYDTSKVTSMSDMFRGCSNLITIPRLDTSKVTNTSYMFQGCSKLSSIPLLNISNVTNMNNMFDSCSNLASIPLLDTSNVTDMSFAFYDCTNLLTIPQMGTSNVTNMNNMFYGCKSLKTIPLLDTSNVTSMQYMFTHCSSLKTIPLLDTSNVTNMGQMFYECTSLTDIPQLDTSKVTNTYQMFRNSRIKTVPQLNLSNVKNMYEMFSFCTSLTTVSPLDTSNATNMSWMFNYCDSLTTVEGIDFSGLTSELKEFFGYFSSSRPNIKRFIVNGKINVSISDNYSIKALTAIDYDSVKSILEAANRTDNNNSKTLTFNRKIVDRDGELASLVASCTTKGWTINGLTIKPREDVILTCSDVVLTDGKVDYVPVTVDSLNNWSITRYDLDTTGKWVELGVYEGSKELLYNYSSNEWGDLTGQAAGINTAKLMVRDFSYAINNWGDLPEGIKFVLYFGIKDSNNARYKYDITLERIDGQVTTTLHTISPYS